MSSSLDSGKLDDLCAACNTVFGRATLIGKSDGDVLPWLPGSHKLHDSVDDLEESVRRRCHFCTLARRVLFDPYYPSSLWIPGEAAGNVAERKARLQSGDNNVWVKLCYGKGGTRIDVAFGTKDDGISTIEDNLWVRCGPGYWERWQPLFLTSEGSIKYLLEGHYWKKCVIHPAASHWNIGSPEHIRLARYWLDECITKHTECCMPCDSFVPSRLIYIENERTPHVNICETDRFEETYRYCTLSHCWGGAEDMLVLKRENIERLRESIAISELARNFQDAIKVVSSLGFQYLWVDSLCILQDCEDDWTFESARMGMIYENAACTIAAEDAYDCHQGFLVDRNPLENAYCKLPGPLEDVVSVRPPRGMMLNTRYRSKLSSRAWTYQEETLSRRKLSFTKDGIFWACRQGIASERNADGYDEWPGGSHAIFGTPFTTVDWNPDGFTRPNANFVKILDISLSQKDLEEAPGMSFSRLWFDIVAEYSPRQMTKATDKLIALSAVAQRIQNTTGFTYCAGLWKEFLVMNMLWWIQSPQEYNAQDDYRAPSWSWASRDGIVSWEYDFQALQGISEIDEEILIQSQEVTFLTHSKDESKTGRVYGGKCTFRGLLKSAAQLHLMPRKQEDSEPDLRVFNETMEFGYFFPDVAETPNIEELSLIPFTRTRELPLDLPYSDMINNPINGLILGLGVRMSADSKHYERVGYFRFKDFGRMQGDAEHPAMEWFNDCLEQDIGIV